jgi:hypothetical protein
MSKAILICVLILSGLTSEVECETAPPNSIVLKPDMSKRAAFDQACLAAIDLTASGRYDQVRLALGDRRDWYD